MKRKLNRYMYIPYAIAVLLFAIATLYDYEIATYVYNPTSMIGMFFERVILIFIIFFVPFSFYGLYRARKNSVWFLCYLLATIYWVIDAAHYWISIMEHSLFVLILVVVAMIVTYHVLKRISTSFYQRYGRFMKFFLLVFLSAMAITIMWKTLWGRVRYREMLDTVSLFTPWYVPQGLNGYNSFPSGHTTAMCSILCFFEFHRVTSDKMPRSKWLCCGVVVLIVMMMLSRMIMGAHFLSDVSMGFCVSYTMYIFWKQKIYWEEVQ